jgi:hypothetical protein
MSHRIAAPRFRQLITLAGLKWRCSIHHGAACVTCAEWHTEYSNQTGEVAKKQGQATHGQLASAD